MILEKTGFEGLFLVKPRVLSDERGFFMESFNKKNFADAGIDTDFVQDNHSCSRKGVLRGLHFQNQPHPQTKLVRVIAGTILDMVVDLRRGQSTFGKAFSGVLSAENKLQLLVPKGFAHGFAVLSDEAEVVYKCDDYYFPETEAGVNILDRHFDLESQLPKLDYILSEKDRKLPNLADARFNF
jgi:dTDP-4-dehydrorhamnose 3,5-epimerase